MKLNENEYQMHADKTKGRGVANTADVRPQRHVGSEAETGETSSPGEKKKQDTTPFLQRNILESPRSRRLFVLRSSSMRRVNLPISIALSDPR